MAGVAAAAAQDAAALLGERGVHAGAPLRAERAQRAVGQTEGRRLLGVDEVHLTGRLDRRVLGHEALAVVAGDHLGGAVEALLEAVAHVAERRHLAPARLEGARAGEAVALTLGAHVVLDGLEERKVVQEFSKYQISIYEY